MESLDKHKGHEVGTVNSVTFEVGYNENGKMGHTEQVSRLELYCYTCDEFLGVYVTDMENEQ